ncbi:ABC transporter ATP-binding protein [Streptosporangium sp. KLBMP 9127]|nr:ABC transporter ATP-binding protein/permease [Streptosporangium sp. KLBMP 9127]
MKPLVWQSHETVVASATTLGILRRFPRLMREAVKLAWAANRRDLLLAVSLNLLAGVCMVSGLVSGTVVLSRLLSQAMTWESLQAASGPLVMVCTLAVLRSSLLALASWSQARLRPQVERIVAARLAMAGTRLPLADFDEPELYDFMRLAKDRGLHEAPEMVQRMVDVAAAVIGLAAAGSVLAATHPVLLPLVLIASVPDGWAAARAGLMRYRLMFQLTASRRRKWILHELMCGRASALEVRAYMMREFLLEEYDKISAQEERLELRLSRREFVVGLQGVSARGLCAGVVYGALAILVGTGMVGVGAAATAVIAVQVSNSSLRNLVGSATSCFQSGLYFEDLVSFLATATARSRRDERPGPADFETISADGIGFAYPGTDSRVIHDVSVRVRKGEMIALVGENGSGKSTLAKLLAGFYEVTEGAVRWDGDDIQGVRREDLWRHVAVIAQDYTQWPLSARHNIVMGNRPDEDGLASAALASGADSVIAGLPEGYDTLLDRRFKGGQELSKGQWQRVAAARAFYRDASLLICDEPTAAMDPAAENALLTAIREFAEDRAVILITHRLEAVRHCDRAYVLAHGRVAESGTHDDLLSLGGLYYESYMLQARRYGRMPGLDPV